MKLLKELYHLDEKREAKVFDDWGKIYPEVKRLVGQDVQLRSSLRSLETLFDTGASDDELEALEKLQKLHRQLKKKSATK